MGGQGQACCVFPAPGPASFLPGRTSPKLTHPKPRDPAAPSHCPPRDWGTTRRGGLPFALCSPALTSRSPSPQAVPPGWPRVPALPAQRAPLRPHCGSIYSFYPVLDAQQSRISNSPSAWSPSAPGFWAGDASGIQGVEAAGSVTAHGEGGRSWLRVGVTAQPGMGQPVGLVPGAERAANLLQLFLCRLWLRAGDLSAGKAPGQSASCQFRGSAPSRCLCAAERSGAGGQGQQLPPQDANPAPLPPARAAATSCCPCAGTEGGQTWDWLSWVLKTPRFNPWMGHSLRSWA